MKRTEAERLQDTERLLFIMVAIAMVAVVIVVLTLA